MDLFQMGSHMSIDTKCLEATIKGVLLELRRAPFIIIYDNKAENR